MSRTTGERSRQEMRLRASKKLMIVFTVILFVGMFAHIFMITRLSGLNRSARAVESEIESLNAMVGNLELALNQRGELGIVRSRAEQLGMIKADGDRIRVVNLPDIVDNTSAQSAENTGAEERNQ